MRGSTAFRTLALLLTLCVLMFSGGALAGSPRINQPASNLKPGAAEPESPPSTSTYYVLRADLRKCASPMCGGFFVRRVNASSTMCVDGKNSSECYVSEIKWNGHTQVDPAKALLRGSILKNATAKLRKIGYFKVEEAWQAAGDNNATGSYYRVKDRGLRCITSPCPTHREDKLNARQGRNIAGVDLSQAGASDDLVNAAFTALTGQGILVAGEHEKVTGPAGKSEKLTSTQFYLRAGSATAKKPCIKTGCSKQICSDHTVMSTCEWREEYACYRQATCERQADGNCGFTKTPELTACLARK